MRFVLITRLECTEDNEEAYETYSEASKNKWKCDKMH